MSRIVCGVDGSEASRRALQWAVHEARLRGTEVEAVHIWSYPPMSYVTGIVPPPTFASDELAAEATAVLAQVCDDVDSTGVTIRREVAEGEPARCLVEHSWAADLLVLGSRGRGGFAGLLLGSVSQMCAHHSRRPVVIVR